MLSSIDATDAPPLAVVAGFATQENAYALSTLRALARTLPLEVVVSADNAPSGWPGFSGYPVEAMRQVTSVPLMSGTEAYLCGPPGMVKAARQTLAATGMDPAEIFNEEFVHRCRLGFKAMGRRPFGKLDKPGIDRLCRQNA